MVEGSLFSPKCFLNINTFKEVFLELLLCVIVGIEKSLWKQTLCNIPELHVVIHVAINNQILYSWTSKVCHFFQITVKQTCAWLSI